MELTKKQWAVGIVGAVILVAIICLVFGGKAEAAQPFNPPDGIRVGVAYQYDIDDLKKEQYTLFGSVKVPLFLREGKTNLLGVSELGLLGGASAGMDGAVYGGRTELAYGGYVRKSFVEALAYTPVTHTDANGFVGDPSKGTVLVQLVLRR